LELVYRIKSWNDNYGHASGDALLRELAALLRAAATDPADLVARNGGDEFCVVLVDAEKSHAIERAERLRASIADADFRGLHAPVSSGEEVRISASIGVACFPVDAPSPETLLEKADEAMYHSKTGRNGVSFLESTDSSCEPMVARLPVQSTDGKSEGAFHALRPLHGSVSYTCE
jgi:diguanylate cyclase (GGDEF)-like protein